MGLYIDEFLWVVSFIWGIGLGGYFGNVEGLGVFGSVLFRKWKDDFFVFFYGGNVRI